jgi:hypothetical protein
MPQPELPFADCRDLSYRPMRRCRIIAGRGELTMAFFIGIAGPWLVIAVLDLLAIRRDLELSRIP